jgi:hypothetical protein
VKGSNCIILKKNKTLGEKYSGLSKEYRKQIIINRGIKVLIILCVGAVVTLIVVNKANQISDLKNGEFDLEDAIVIEDMPNGPEVMIHVNDNQYYDPDTKNSYYVYHSQGNSKPVSQYPDRIYSDSSCTLDFYLTPEMLQKDSISYEEFQKIEKDIKSAYTKKDDGK